MPNKTYTRPVKTSASAVGERNRTRWSRLLRKKLFEVFPTVEIMAAEESAVNAALGKRRTSERPNWTTVRVRIDQSAALGMLQERHLEATGKEISRAEALAALMAAGLSAVLQHEAFKAPNT